MYFVTEDEKKEIYVKFDKKVNLFLNFLIF